MASKLYVGGLPYSYGEEELRELFKEYGEIESAFVVMDKETRRSKGFGFVEFSSEDDANNAVKAMHDQEVDGRKITVDHARPPAPR